MTIGNEPSTPPMSNIPVAPGVSTDPLLETLPGSVIAQQESSTILRIGVVAAIIEGTQITVKISGSNSLVDCSYLFTQYYPLLGDRVILLKQDSQWICIGQMTGPIGSNNLLFNGSFEDPAVIAAAPTGWGLNVIASAGGVPTFLIASSGATNITGTQVVDFGSDSVGAGISIADATSSVVSTVPDTHWTAAYYLTGVFVASSPPLFSELEMHIEFVDTAAVVVSSLLVNVTSLAADAIGPIYRRINLTTYPNGYVIAPAGTAGVRIRFRGIFDLPAASYVSFYIDNVILRQVG